MSFAEKLMQAYFNSVYNPVYDFTTGGLSLYQKLQTTCISKLELKDNDKVLCVGLGTGNEISRILDVNTNVNIVGVDYSSTALRKAYQKALRLGKEIELLAMDVRCLQFSTGSFDKVVCIHVMDFVEENKEVTSEILRVLRNGGQFVITYPSEKEGPKLGCNLLRDRIRSQLDSRKHPIQAFLELVAQMVVSFVYLPLAVRPNKRSYSRHKLETMIAQLVIGDFRIEEDAVYQDFIVYGRK